MEQTLTIAFRSGERLLIVAVAALCIWLGYRLFQSLPAVHGSDGKLELPSAKLVMSKIGPGVFFALFGAIVLWQAITTQLRIEPDANGRTRVNYGVVSGGPQALRHVQNDIEVLNCLASSAPEDLSSGSVETALHKARVALLAPVWKPDWGPAAFDALERGEVPTSGAVAEIYRARHHACPSASKK